jgi:flagellar biosynthesis protein FlhF
MADLAAPSQPKSPAPSDAFSERLMKEMDKEPVINFSFPTEFTSTRDTALDLQFDPRSETKTEPALPRQKIEWSQEPTLVQIQSQMKDLRSLLEQQMSSLAWSDLQRRNPHRAKLTRALLEMGLSPQVCQHVVDACQDEQDYETLWNHALSLLAHGLPVAQPEPLEKGGVIAVVGATGVGKTTTVAKLAARYALRHGSDQVAMITTDSYRIAAHEQLRTYGRILDIPVRVADKREDLVDAIKVFSDRGLVLIDTAGMSQRDVRLSQQFQLIKRSAPDIKTYLVLSTVTHRAGLKDIVRAFGEVRLDGCILTKLDETTSLGGALSTAIENKLRIAYLSDGQRVPEDIHIARAQTLIEKAVTIARDTNQGLEQEILNLAFSGMVANAHG